MPAAPSASELPDLALTRLDGSTFSLRDYAGQVLLIVNTASECGFTPQYGALQALHDRYRVRGFSVIGFPCNQFGQQEPGTAEQIAAFCEQNFGVGFPLCERIEVNGAHAHALFVHLKRQAPGILGTRAIKWNFTKFLLDRSGRVVGRYAPRTDPLVLAPDIERLLAA